jgi:hypothetical protein
MGPPSTWRGRFGARWWPAGRVERPPPTFSIDSGFSSSCRCVAIKAQAEPPQTLADRLAPRPTQPGVWPTLSKCQIHPMVMMILTFGQLHFVIP